MKVEEIVNILAKQGMYLTDRKIWESALYFYASVLLNVYNIKNEDEENINYYSILFAPSGAGKTFVSYTVSKVIGFEKYPVTLKKAFIKNNKDDKMSKKDEKDFFDMYNSLPNLEIVSLEGTSEGIFSVANAVEKCGLGSLNLLSEEFGDIITGSFDMIAKLKELYDGRLLGKVIKSESNINVKNITANMFAFGSKGAVISETKDSLIKLAKTGLFRRTFLLNIDHKKIKVNDNPEKLKEYETLKKYFSTLKSLHKVSLQKKPMKESKEAKKMYIEIQKALVDKANENIMDEYRVADVGSLKMIKNLSYIIAFIEMNDTVQKEHVGKAYEFFKQCRASTEDFFKPEQPYVSMFNILLDKNNLTYSEILEIDDTLPTQKLKKEEMLNILYEYAIRNNYELKISGLKVERYSIEPMPKTTLDKLIVSVENMTNEVSNFEIDIDSLLGMFNFEQIRGIYLNHFIGKKIKEDNYELGQNIVYLEIDEKDIEKVEEKLKEYKYIKSGSIIMLISKTKIFINDQLFKQIVEYFEKRLSINIPNLDSKKIIKNVKQADAVFNNGKDFIDMYKILQKIQQDVE